MSLIARPPIFRLPAARIHITDSLRNSLDKAETYSFLLYLVPLAALIVLVIHALMGR